MSGDVFGYFPLTPGILGFYAADVCGHGVRAALSAVALAHLITPEYFWAAVCAAPAEGNVICTADLVEALDSRFMGSDDDNYFTLFAGALVEASDELRFCQAGYPSPLLIRANGVTEWVGSGGMPVGMLPNAEFECDSVTLRPGDRLVVYSDGVIEAENPQGESFGEERLADFVCLRPDQPANSVLAELSAHLRNWTTNEVFADDISMILIERE